MPWKVERRKNKFVVVRENGKVVAEHDSKAKAMRQVRALYASEYWVRKARARMFASRSEAGRYAAHIRWANNRGQEPLSVADWRASDAMELPDDIVPQAQTEAGRLLQSLLNPDIDLETGRTTAGSTILPFLEFSRVEASSETSYAEQLIEQGAPQIVEPHPFNERPTDFLVDMSVQIDIAPPTSIRPDTPQLHMETMSVARTSRWVSSTLSSQQVEFKNPMYEENSNRTLNREGKAHYGAGAIVDLSPPNPKVNVEALLRWERPSPNLDSWGDNWGNVLGYFASKQAGFGEPYAKPTSFERGGGLTTYKMTEAKAETLGRGLYKSLTNAPPAQPGLWRGISGYTPTVSFKTGDTFRAGTIGFSQSASSAQEYASLASGTSGMGGTAPKRMMYLEPGSRGLKIPHDSTLGNPTSRFPWDTEVISGGTFRVKAVEVVRVPTTAQRNVVLLKDRYVESVRSQLTDAEYRFVKNKVAKELAEIPPYEEIEVTTLVQESV